MTLDDLKGETIGFAASGGLDSCTTTRWLSDNGVKVVSISADLAQPDEKDLEAIKKRMLACGAVEAIVVDARKQLAEAGLKMIQAQACYEGRYWNTTGIARYVTTAAILPELKKRGIRIFSHGATGRGNDQVRFQLATNMLEPSMEIFAPWRNTEFLERFGGRKEMIDFCNERDLPITASHDKPYSTDANMLGLTHEAGKLESLAVGSLFISPGMGVHPDNAPNEAEEVEIEFKAGVPVAINGKKLDLLDVFLTANRLGGKHGVGIGTHLVENRFVGIKSRGVYESPGMELLGTAYELVQQLVLDRRARELYDQLSKYVSKQVYQGFWYDLGTTMALSAIASVSALVTGRVRLSLYKGMARVVSITETPSSLYSESTASMERVGTYNHEDAEGLLSILGVSARALASAGQVRAQ